MPITSISITTSTFFEWMTKTNQLISIANLGTEGQSNSTGTLTLTNDGDVNGGVTLNVAAGLIKGDGGLLSNVSVSSLDANTINLVSNSATITVSQSPAFLGGVIYLDIGSLSTDVNDTAAANIASALSVNTAMNQATYASITANASFGQANGAYTRGNTAWNAANNSNVYAATVNTRAAAAHDKANAAYAAANTAVTDYSPAFDKANTAFAAANTANVNAANATFMTTGTVLTARMTGEYTGITRLGTQTGLVVSNTIVSTSGGFKFPNGNTITNWTVSTSSPSGGTNGDVWIIIP